jgi:hypothetical protein
MQPTCAVQQPNKVQGSPCCHSKADNTLKTVDFVCRVAICVFAAWLNPLACAVSLVSGAIAGGIYECMLQKKKITSLTAPSSQPVCAQGYMEFFSGMRFPPALGIIATAAFFAAHMRCDPLFHVPFCSFFVAFSFGTRIAGKI